MNLVRKSIGHISGVLLAAVLAAANAHAAANEAVLSHAQQAQPAMLKTMQELAEIESGSADREGLDRIAETISARLRALGGKVELIEAGPEVYRMFDTPEKLGRMVRATFTGTGKRRILLLAHMDTVYPRGMLAQ
jgi:glutamate carboxypeptidase